MCSIDTSIFYIHIIDTNIQQKSLIQGIGSSISSKFGVMFKRASCHTDVLAVVPYNHISYLILVFGNSMDDSGSISNTFRQEIPFNCELWRTFKRIDITLATPFRPFDVYLDFFLLFSSSRFFFFWWNVYFQLGRRR